MIVTESVFSLLKIDRYLFPLTTLNRCKVGVQKISFYYYILEYIWDQTKGILGDPPTFGPYHDLNNEFSESQTRKTPLL